MVDNVAVVLKRREVKASFGAAEDEEFEELETDLGGEFGTCEYRVEVREGTKGVI